jgi:hypothetical protein
MGGISPPITAHLGEINFPTLSPITPITAQWIKKSRVCYENTNGVFTLSVIQLP